MCKNDGRVARVAFSRIERRSIRVSLLVGIDTKINSNEYLILNRSSKALPWAPCRRREG